MDSNSGGKIKQIVVFWKKIYFSGCMIALSKTHLGVRLLNITLLLFRRCV